LSDGYVFPRHFQSTIAKGQNCLVLFPDGCSDWHGVTVKRDSFHHKVDTMKHEEIRCMLRFTVGDDEEERQFLLQDSDKVVT
jgi:hypothetical protein